MKFREGEVRYVCYDYHSPQADGNDAVLAAKSTISLRNSMLIETPDLIDNDCSVARQPVGKSLVFQIGKTILQGVKLGIRV